MYMNQVAENVIVIAVVYSIASFRESTDFCTFINKFSDDC